MAATAPIRKTAVLSSSYCSSALAAEIAAS
jgi:hypothetical protein